MTERPDQVTISCESCKQTASLSTIYRHRGVCKNCGHDKWYVQATYLARQDNADGTTLALNAIGLSLLTSSGVSIGGPLPAEKKPINGVDIHDVPAATICELADPAVDPSVKLDAFVALKRNEQFQLHRQQMERNGQECEKCGMLFVRNDSKPWTLVGTCSKVCCAAKFGVSDYALVEDEVADQARRIAPEMKQRQRSNLVIHVECPACQHHFDLPKMYGGVYRKCPACQEKVLVPTA